MWKKKSGPEKFFFNFVLSVRETVLKTGCEVTVPCLCWPLQAKVKTLKQTLSDTFLFLKGSAVCASSPQHSSLLVTSRRCAADVLSPIFCTGLGGRSVLHIRQWEVGRMMFSLLNLAP